MQSPSVDRGHAIKSPLPVPLLERAHPPSTLTMPAANDDITSGPAEYRPKPLWAVNAALAAFLLVAALVIASG